MRNTLVTTKISPDALRLVRLIAALNGEMQYAVVDRLVQAEAERLGLLKLRAPE